MIQSDAEKSREIVVYLPVAIVLSVRHRRQLTLQIIKSVGTAQVGHIPRAAATQLPRPHRDTGKKDAPPFARTIRAENFTTDFFSLENAEKLHFFILRRRASLQI
jgi:hypothetical protein